MNSHTRLEHVRSIVNLDRGVGVGSAVKLKGMHFLTCLNVRRSSEKLQGTQKVICVTAEGQWAHVN